MMPVSQKYRQVSTRLDGPGMIMTCRVRYGPSKHHAQRRFRHHY